MSAVPRSFFGMMYQGSSVDVEGNVQSPYFPIPVGVVRTWDTTACMTFMGVDPIDASPLTNQTRLAQRNAAQVLFTFGFSGDEHFPPPADALIPGSRNRPQREYLDRVIDAVLNYSETVGRIHMYEEGNEPAIANLYWDGTPEEAYEQFAFIYQRIKARDPLALVLSPSLNDLLEPSGLAFAMRYGSLMRSLGPACDAVAFHMYAHDTNDIYAQLANLDKACDGLSLDYFCTEYNGPWEAFDIFAARGIKLLVLNGQQPPAPYSDPALAMRWYDMVTRLTTSGPNIPPSPDLRKRGGCSRFLPSFRK